ncbi:MAG: alpha/beta fold hydrolase, partial [Aquihabitans sp.]
MPQIELSTADEHEFTAYRADPDGPPLGAVVVIQEIFGVNSHMRDVADQFAAAGFVAVAPALFDRIEPGIELGYDASGVGRAKSLAWKMPIEDALTDMATTAEALAEEFGGAAHVGVVGYCWGGMLTAALASRHSELIAGAVAYYPSKAAQLLVDDRPQVPLMVHLGDKDTGVTPADGRTLEERWPTATFHRYEQAGHGFNCDQRPGHDAEASAQAF